MLPIEITIANPTQPPSLTAIATNPEPPCAPFGVRCVVESAEPQLTELPPLVSADPADIHVRH